MAAHELAGKQAPASILIDVPGLISSYYMNAPQGPVSFGTSGHRGSSTKGTFNEAHIMAIAQAICEYRALKGINGPLFLGFDTHALSAPAFRTALEVFAANNVETIIHEKDEFTPTPVISFLILEYNRKMTGREADGVVITPSHNPPQDGGFKYNPPHGGPADVDVTRLIEDRANELMAKGNKGVRRISYERARKADTTHEEDLASPFVRSISRTIDMELIRRQRIRIGADPMGGSGAHYWQPIAEEYKLDIKVVNNEVDPTFGFMTVDYDGQIRMDCSSPHAMANLIQMANRFDIAWGNDPDFDRHGIVCPDGLMNPNHYLSVAIWYLIQNRASWKHDISIGKTLVSSSMIDRVVRGLGKSLYEVPVGFKWFVNGLLDGSVAFGGEESAGATFLRMDGTAWTTDKDGFCMSLLAAEILAKTGNTPSEIYREKLTPQYGEPYYMRADSAITDRHRERLNAIRVDSLKGSAIAGLPIREAMTRAPGNGAPIGGVKIELQDGSWFAVRPSGTEPKMKVYVESFGGKELWQRIHDEAISLIFGDSEA
jgi:phosphoglucomutase